MQRRDETQDLPSMEAESMNSQMSCTSSEFSDRGNSFNGFDQYSHHVINANKSDMLNQELELNSYQKRLETFLRWPSSSPVNPADLAAAGFYSLNLDDRVACFRCNLHLRQWNIGDDPWMEHKRIRPACPFIMEHENANGYVVTCNPVEASIGVQEPGHPPFPTATHVRYGGRVYLTERDPPVNRERLIYPERPQYVTYGGMYDTHEQHYPTETRTGFPQGYYDPGRRPQEFLGKDPTPVDFQRRPEHELNGTERNRHVVVRQGANQIHIVGSAVHQLNPEDKLNIQSGGHGFPPQIRTERDLRQVYPGLQQSGRVPPPTETSFTGSHPFSRDPYRYISEDQRSGMNQFEQSIKSHPPSHAGTFPGYQRSESVTNESTAMFHKGSASEKYMVQLEWEGDKMEYGRDPSRDTRAPKQLYMPERKVSNEGEPHPYTGSKSDKDVVETRPTQPPQDRNSWQPVRNASGPRRQSQGYHPAFPVKDPSLQTEQRPLVRQEDARHVASPSDLPNEHHRLTTFVDWPHDHHIRPWDLSAAGFYYLGTGDSVKCYKCGIMLHNWEPSDTPWGEHQKWSTQCPLVLEHFRGRPHVPTPSTPAEHAVQRVSPVQNELQGWRPVKSLSGQDVHSPIRGGNTPPLPGTWSTSEQYPARTMPSSANGWNPSTEQHYTQWQTQPFTASAHESHVASESQTRLTGGSSSSTPKETKQEPRSCSPRGSTAMELDMEKLGEMGFTQHDIQEAVAAKLESTGSNFNTFPELVSALLERQHTGVPTFGSCAQPTPQEGEERPPRPHLDIPEREPSPREDEGLRERNCLSAVTSPTTPVPRRDSLRRTLSAPASRSSETEESLEEKLERMQEERTCKICMDAEVGMVFLPCGHLSCCPDCARGMDVCPMCRRPIQERIRTYLS